MTAIAPDGSLVTSIAIAELSAAPRDASVTITCDEHQTVGLYSPDHQEPPFTFLALLSPSGFLELVIVGDSAKIMLGIRVGESVTVQW